MSHASDTKVLIVVFDALRPEFVRPDLMPNLHALAQEGVHYQNSRSTFPTETRVNQTAVLTGCYPRKHGIVGNRFPLVGIEPPRVVNTGEDVQIAEAFKAAAPGRLIMAPTMGERLYAAGRCFASLSAGTPGGGRLINHLAEDHGTFRLAMRCPGAAQPPGMLDELISAIGPMPEYELPAIAWIEWAVSAYLQFIVPKLDPDVMLLWLCEPDESFHFLGIGSDSAIATMKNADAQLGRILDHRRAEIESGTLQIVAMSDHGQISLQGDRLELADRVSSAGFRASTEPGATTDCTVVAGNAGGIWIRDHDEATASGLVDWLIKQEWCGAIFTREGIAGTLPHSQIRADHPRAPDIYVNMNYSGSVNEWGISGSSRHDAPYPVGGGCHGGLSQFELENVLILSGTKFKQSTKMTVPAANTDVLATTLNLLGLSVPDEIDGRLLTEALSGSPDEDATAASTKTISVANGHSLLSVTDYAGNRYINRAWT